jgi:hypothetical protein
MAMTIEKLLAEKQPTLLKKWFRHVVATYPADSAKFLLNQSDPFANPVGRTTEKGLAGLLQLLTSGHGDDEAARSYLDAIIRMRAVQSFSASQAVAFVFALKEIVRETLGAEVIQSAGGDALLQLERRIDALGLRAFDIYAACREKICDIKANELRRSTYRAFERAKLLVEIPEEPAADGPPDPVRTP